MRDRSDRFQVQTVPLAPTKPKRLGAYLVEAGLLTSAQIDVALNDQKIVGDMRFGEVLVARGWIKQQTLDYLIKKIIEPEQRAVKQERPTPTTPPREHPTIPPKTNLVEGVNDRKPLPSVQQQKDDGVSWVG
ncbi:hypothetical protein ACKFKG_10165 [Phormidesmis sp. 146-35]